MKQIIIIATRNQGKSREIKELLKGQPVQIMDLSEFGPFPEPEENADTFEDNAYIKAFHYARDMGFAALADDSGLVIEALGGKPGVHSARWAGEDATDDDRIAKVFTEMEGKENRKASFYCSLVLAVPNGPALTWVGECIGEILKEKRGENGFGYDPIFYYPPHEKTFAEMTPEEKNQVSHRGKALRDFVNEFPKVLVWLEKRWEELYPSCH